MVSESDLLWTPSPDRVAASRLTDFTRWVEADRGLTFGSYEDLHRWSIEDLDGFWSALAQWVGVRWSTAPERVLDRPGDAGGAMVSRRPPELRGAPVVPAQ